MMGGANTKNRLFILHLGVSGMVVRVDRVTVAVNNMPAMVRFYNAAFGADLELIDPTSEFPFHAGHLGNLDLIFCPNSLTQIEAEKNRQQLRLVVEDLETVLAAALRAGGQVLGEVQRAGPAVMVGLSDPDNNSIEVIQYLD